MRTMNGMIEDLEDQIESLFTFNCFILIYFYETGISEEKSR